MTEVKIPLGEEPKISTSGNDKEKKFVQAIRDARRDLWYDRMSNDRSREAAAQATLARLRQAAGRQPEDDPLAWEAILEQVIAADFPQECIGKGDKPSVYERAAFDTFTLYALHQRSLTVDMYKAQVSVGRASAMLAKETGSKSIKPRFDALLVATSNEAVDHHLRSLVAMFNDRAITLDHGQLALDLVKLRNPKRRDAVRLRWGRDFARALYEKTETSTDNKSKSSSK